MSDDLIKRSDAIKALHDEWDECLVVDESGEHIADICEDVIDTIPSADRPQGEWIDAKNAGWKCTVCGKWSNGQYDYCPNCGARMKGADDE